MAQKGYHHMTQAQRCGVEALLSPGTRRAAALLKKQT
jgi:hypothetical protein